MLFGNCYLAESELLSLLVFKLAFVSARWPTNTNVGIKVGGITAAAVICWYSLPLAYCTVKLRFMFLLLEEKLRFSYR